MKRFRLVLPLFVLLISTFAAADSVPIFNLTQGSVTLTPDHAYGGVDQAWTFKNSGITISGFNYYGLNVCLSWAQSGFNCDSSINIVNYGLPQPNMGTVSGSNSPILFLGGVNISGPSFLMPTGSDLTTFSVTMPVLFSGSFNACVSPGVGANAGCYDESYKPNPVFAIFNVNGKGVANLSFTSYGGGTNYWRLTSGTYTITSAPEPSSIMLLGTGAVGLIAAVRRRLRG